MKRLTLHRLASSLHRCQQYVNSCKNRHITVESFILPLAKCFIIFTDFPKPSCCSVNSSYKAAWELQIAFLKPPGNLCTALGRLQKSSRQLSCSFRKPVCSSGVAFKKQLNTTARGFRKICENSKPVCQKRHNHIQLIFAHK